MISFCLIGSLTGCETAPKVITKTKIQKVYQDRYVPVPSELTENVEIVQPPDKVDTITLRTMFLDQRTAARMCNGQLDLISQLGEDDASK